MKTLHKKVTGAVIVLVLMLLPLKSYSQLEDIGKLISGGTSDAEKIAEAYLTPLTDAFGATLNGGWFNTARNHRVLGFDLTISANLAMIPTNAKYFAISELQLSPGATVTGPPTSPTFAGSSSAQRPMIRYTETVGNDEYVLAEYYLPKGTGAGYVPAPTIQLGLGLPKDTDIMFRYLPNFDIGNAGTIGLWGIGVKHSLKQWIPVVSRLPLINLSVMAGYTSFNTNVKMDIKPSDIGASYASGSDDQYGDQELDFSVNSFTANVLASVDIPLITLYGGLGVNTTSAGLKLIGDFPVPSYNSSTQEPEVTPVTNPIDMKLGGTSNKLSPRATVGAKFKLAILHFHVDYTYSNYSVISGGVGLSIR